MPPLTPFGANAFRFALSAPLAPAQRRELLDSLRAIEGVEDVVLGEEQGAVFFASRDRDVVEKAAVARLETQTSSSTAHIPRSPQRHEIDVVYDGEDLAEVARATGWSVERVVAAHAERDYEVAMLGFLPGFAYLRGLAPELQLPRRKEPRKRVPAKSVAIAAEYTGIYPFASPGGWHLLGQAPSFEPLTSTIEVGDIVRFISKSSRATATAPPTTAANVELTTTQQPHLEIARVNGFAVVVDGGRIGHMHRGWPRSGPLVRSLYRQATNDSNDRTAAVEVYGSIEVIARNGDIEIATSSSDARRKLLVAGERHTVRAVGTRVAYLAFGEGRSIDVPIVLNSRSSLIAAGIGAPLKRGDKLRSVARDDSVFSEAAHSRIDDRVIRILPGPDHVDGFSNNDIVATDLRIASASDRTGTRLEGWALSSSSSEEGAGALRRVSSPMTMGAIELTPSGLIVFGPDHPTTGGYPVVGVIDGDDLDAFFARPIGSVVHFK